MKRAILVGLLLGVPSAIYAQRDLHMNIAAYNPGNEAAYVEFTAGPSTTPPIGKIRCSSRHGKRVKVARGDRLTDVCTASAENVRINRSKFENRREVEFNGTGWADCHFQRLIGQFSLKVSTGSHKFHCSGCKLEQDWSGCPASGTCTVNVLITLSGNAPNAPGCP